MEKLYRFIKTTVNSLLKLQTVNTSPLNGLFPNRCYFCGRVILRGVGICDECLNEIDLINKNRCLRCGAPVNIEGITVLMCSNCGGFDFSFESNRSLFVYEKKIKELIHLLKFSRRWMLTHLFSDLFVNSMKDFIEGFNWLIPVPLNKLRYRDRGYNQSLLIAEQIGKRLEIGVGKSFLSRKGNSAPQSSTSGFFDRYNNMKDVIYVPDRFKPDIGGTRVLLIDDVLTTGVTASRCADALYEYGAVNVSLITVARTLR